MWKQNQQQQQKNTNKTKPTSLLFEHIGIICQFVELQFRPLISIEWFLNVSQNKSDQIQFKILILMNKLILILYGIY